MTDMTRADFLLKESNRSDKSAEYCHEQWVKYCEYVAHVRKEHRVVEAHPEDVWVKRQAEIYLKLRPFIRRSGNRLIWDPSTDEAFAPTFEQFLEIGKRRTVHGIDPTPAPLYNLAKFLDVPLRCAE